jgi:hypothetical protein
LQLNPETALPFNPETALLLNPETALQLNPGTTLLLNPEVTRVYASPSPARGPCTRYPLAPPGSMAARTAKGDQIMIGMRLPTSPVTPPGHDDVSMMSSEISSNAVSDLRLDLDMGI